MDKIYSLIGLAKKSGNIKSGEMGCIEAIKKNKCKLLVIAEDASQNTSKKFINLCKKYNINFIRFGIKGKLGRSIGKENISVISILDSNFSNAISNLISRHL